MNEVDLLNTPDGHVWAKEFIGMNFKPEQIDEGLMIAWFCNAIECGRDHESGCHKAKIAAKDERIKALEGELLRLFKLEVEGGYPPYEARFPLAAELAKKESV